MRMTAIMLAIAAIGIGLRYALGEPQAVWLAGLVR